MVLNFTLIIRNGVKSFSQAFEHLKLNRVAFHVDSRNKRSRSAMLKLGATLEGVMKKHKIVQGDYIRDTVLYSLLEEN